MSVYGGLFHRFAFPAWEAGIHRRPTLAHLAALDRSQWWSPDALRAEQDRALAELIAHAYENVPFYREQMRARGLQPNDVRSVEELSRLPLLSREDAQRAGERRASVRAPLRDVVKGTSGSTGTPLRFGYDLGSEWWRQATKLRGWGWMGYRVGDPTFYFWGPALGDKPSWKARAKVAGDRLLRRETYVDCTNRDPASLACAVARLRASRAERVIGYTQGLVDLARFIVERGLRSWDDLPVICCAEKLAAADRALLEAAFGPAHETYGCREVMLIGAECEAHDGLHLSMENLVVEVLVRDGDRARAARPGEVGEVAITDLHNWGMPFIRYLVGDVAVAGKAERCACGRGLQRLASVEGRVADALRSADGAPVCGILLSRVFCTPRVAESVRKWQAVQHRDGSVTVKIEPWRALPEETLSRMRADLSRYVKGLPVTTEIVPFIAPGKNGKRRSIIVEAAQGAV